MSFWRMTGVFYKTKIIIDASKITKFEKHSLYIERGNYSQKKKNSHKSFNDKFHQ